MKYIENCDALRYCYYVLFSNGSKSKLGRPFTLSLKNNSVKCLDIIFELLSMDNSMDYMSYISLYLKRLLLMNRTIINSFI